jgi:prepilin-type processing-associated H-X9-DG protein
LKKVTQINKPSDCFVFIEEHPSSIEDGTFGLFAAPSTQWLNFPSDRHNQGVNLTFVDGHALKHKWKAPKNFVYQGQPTSGTADKEDLKFLQLSVP